MPRTRERKLSLVTRERGLNLTPYALIYGFLTLIALGTVLLWLPISTASSQFSPFIDALFTATSAVCVTGLVVVDTGTYWSYFGQSVILLLIQAGGFGIMTGTTLILIGLGRKVGLQQRAATGETLGQPQLGGLLSLVKRMGIFVLIAEVLGALVFFARFAAQVPILTAARRAVFHAVSAFNNAGFDVFGSFHSMQDYQGDFVVVLGTAVLIISGGISFVTLHNVYAARGPGRVSPDSKIVLTVTAALLLLGWLFTLLTEAFNPATLGNMPPAGKLLASFFHSVTARTAGFSTIDVSTMAPSTLFFTMILMFIGGATGSTAGGIKVNTLGLLVATLWSALRGEPHASVFGRELIEAQIHRAFAILLLSLGAVGLILFCLTLTEEADFLSLLFETVSAFGTVGLTTGITAGLSTAGKLLITAMIFIGRLGPVTLAVSLTQREKPASYRYPREAVRIG